jgi:hypothetical protein
MKIPSPDGMTLRQKLTEADKLTRELNDHLERGFVPRVQRLRQVTRHGPENESVTDLTVRSMSAQVLESAEFSSELLRGLDQFLSSVNRETNRGN